MFARRVVRTTAAVVSLIVAAVVIAACGSSSTTTKTGSSNASGATTTASASTTPVSASTTSSGASTASSGLLTLSQLYKGNSTPPPATSPKPAKNVNVWWVSCGQQAATCAQYSAAAKAAVQALGWTFHLADGNLNVANGYATAVRTALAANPSAIFLSAIPCSAVEPELAQAKAQHVPVMGVETLDCSATGGPSLFTVPLVYSTTYPNDKAFWEGWGSFAANYMVADSGGDAKVIASFGEGQPFTTLQENGFKATLAKCSGCSIVANDGWTTTSLAPNGPWVTGLQGALLKYPSANYVWWPFDTNGITSGGVKAVVQSGSKAKIVGGIGIGPALQDIANGEQYAEAPAVDPGWPEWAAMDELNRYLHHQPAVPEGIGYIAVTKDHNMPASLTNGYVSAIPYQADYKKAWGVS
jgi:ribose transport system substrate-binding protein